MLEFAVTAFTTFFVIIDPIGQVPIFMALTSQQTSAVRRRTAARSVVLAGMILLIFAFVGDVLLRLLGITLPAFRIAGGILLLLVSIDMIFARQSGLRSTTEDEAAEAEDRADVAVFPIAVPLLAGPGAITSIILLTGRAEGDAGLQALVVVVMFFVLALCLAAFLFASRVMKLLGLTGVNVVGRISGIILAALAVQYVIDGVTEVFPRLVAG